AVASGSARLGPCDLVTLQEGTALAGGPVGLIGAGTGLGHGFLLWDKGSYGAFASEAGHTAFAARDALEWGLAEFLTAQFGRASWERVLSGAGLVHLYQYLVASSFVTEQPRIRDEMASDDPAAVVTRNGLS